MMFGAQGRTLSLLFFNMLHIFRGIEAGAYYFSGYVFLKNQTLIVRSKGAFSDSNL